MFYRRVGLLIYFIYSILHVLHKHQSLFGFFFLKICFLINNDYTQGLDFFFSKFKNEIPFHLKID